MLNTKKISLLPLFFCACSLYAQNTASNPVLLHSNAPIQFNAVSAPAIRQAVDESIKNSDSLIKKISSVAKSRQTVQNTLMAADELFYNLVDVQAKLGLISAAYMDDSIRNAATDENNRLGLYFSNLLLNEGLYTALKQFATGSKAKALTAPQNKFLKETLQGFEKNGMKLPAAERKELEAINGKIIELGSQFDKNIAESKDSLVFTEAELKGVPDRNKESWKKPDGSYVVYINNPNYTTISQYAESSDSRRRIFLHNWNKAYPANITVLDSLLFYRQKLAQKLGFKSYAAYAVADKMAASTDNVWNFENDLTGKLTPGVTKELAVLKDLKPQKDSFFAWDFAYYNKQLLDAKYKLNTDELKEYFEMNNTIQGMFGVYEKLFNIQVREVKGSPVWDGKVRSFEMLKDGKKTGNFYLDLYPRENKYKHFACFPISQYRIANGREVLPVAALLCNFPEGSAGQPALLPHGDVITLFHEFGHLVHFLLCHPAIASQNAFGVKGDFVEAPSQFLENWCWEYASLKTFAKHYKTGKVLPKELFDKMKASQQVNSSITTMRQVYLGTMDFTFEDKYEQSAAKGLLQTSRDLYSITQQPYPDSTNFISSFGHLNGYGANYYGYLWSLVFAKDMFSSFQKEGVMNKQTGLRYRKEVLEKGATKSEMDMLRSFLGREPNSKAFLQSLGIK